MKILFDKYLKSKVSCSCCALVMMLVLSGCNMDQVHFENFDDGVKSFVNIIDELLPEGNVTLPEVNIPDFDITVDVGSENGDNANINDKNNNVSNKQIEDLYGNIVVDDGISGGYDRDEFTSVSQHYECNNDGHDHNQNSYNGDDDGDYSGIRAYSYYESVWYQWDTDTYVDPYTNKVIYDVKKTDYDHIIPLNYCYSHGGNLWNEDQKKAYADDPSVGVCCNASDNRAKGAKGPSEWLPKENKAAYCYTWLVIADQWGLTIAKDDMDVIMNVLENAQIDEIFLINEYVG